MIAMVSMVVLFFLVRPRARARRAARQRAPQRKPWRRADTCRRARAACAPQELRAFLTTTTKTQVMIDRSSDGACAATQRGRRLFLRRAPTHPAPAARAGDLLRINFNISFPHLACQYASVDLSDVLGMVRCCRDALRR